MTISSQQIDTLINKRAFLAKFTPRPQCGKRLLLPELEQHIGTVLLCRIAWQMDNDDPYPGEWAIAGPLGEELLGRTWIASGDLTLVVPDYPLRYEAALEKAGLMADLVVELLGGRSLNGVVGPANPDHFSRIARRLREAAEDYNEEIMRLL